MDFQKLTIKGQEAVAAAQDIAGGEDIGRRAPRAHTNAPTPVIARPTISVLISRVPS